MTTDAKAIVENGPYKGWTKGQYLYWPGTTDLMTKEEEAEFFRQEKAWRASLKADTNRPPSLTFVGADGVERELPDSLVGVMETERPVVEAARRFDEGEASWEEFVFFAIRYDYVPPVIKDAVVLTRKGELYSMDETWSFTPRSFEDINTAVAKRYISPQQKRKIYGELEEFEKTFTKRIKALPYGVRT